MLKTLRQATWAGIGVAGLAGAGLADPPAKNVIVMVADGGGFNSYIAASMYQGRWDASRNVGRQVYDGPGWLKLAASTHPLTTSSAATKTAEQDPKLVYDSVRAWNPATGYDWLKSNYTDSAAAGTALATGHKTYNSGINWGNDGNPIGPTLTEAAFAAGKSAGVVTSVQWSHATPAAFGPAKSPQRDAYESIANQMLQSPVLSVIMGAGHPAFDNDGNARDPGDHQYVGGEATWQAIEQARQARGEYEGFTPISTLAEFEALAAGDTPARVVGTAQAHATLHQARKGDPNDPAKDTPPNANVPSLATMTRGALNVLDADPEGFFLMVEGGAVDWASHSNHPGRMIQEQIAFNDAVEAVVQWVQTHSSWDQTLVILTADHETGLLWGPDSKDKPFALLTDRGAGQVPGLAYHSGSHTNSLVPVYARGAGAELLKARVRGEDPVRGDYVDNTDLAHVALEAMTAPTPVTAEAALSTP